MSTQGITAMQGAHIINALNRIADALEAQVGPKVTPLPEDVQRDWDLLMARMEDFRDAE